MKSPKPTAAALAPGIAVLALAALLFSAAGCPSRARPAAGAPTELSRDGVSVRILDEALAGNAPRSQAARGDVLVTAPKLQAVVGGRRSRQAGALLDFVTDNIEDDALDSFSTIVAVDGATLALETTSVELDDSGPLPGVRVEQRGARCRVTTTLRPRVDGSGLDVHSELRLTGAAARVALGDRVTWFGAPPFLPGHGYLPRDGRVTAPWLARAARRQAYALAGDAPLHVDLVTGLRGPTEQLAFGRTVSLKANQPLIHERTLLLAPTLTEVSALAWARAKVPTGLVKTILKPMPAWALVEARDHKGHVVAVGEADSRGQVVLTLPKGAHTLELRSPGGTDVQQTKVTPGQTHEVQFVVPAAASLSFRITDQDDRLIPARLDIRGEPPTPDPDLGPRHLASGAKTATHTADGTGTLALPTGRYRVIATHGPEYTLFQQSVSVSAHDGAVVRGRLERVVDSRGWVGCDFHLHAEPSGDSDVPLRDRIISLLAEGVGFAAATDHNHVTDYAPALAQFSGVALKTVVGVELTTRDFGHFNAFPLPAGYTLPNIAQSTPATLFSDVRARAPGAVIQVNHPRMGTTIGYFDQAELDVRTGIAKRAGASLDFDTIEVFNGFELNSIPVVERNLKDLLSLRLARPSHRIVGVGNSDSHSLDTHAAGYPRTYVYVGDAKASVENVTRALALGHVTVTNGPFVEVQVGDKVPGETLSTNAAEVSVRVVVQAAPWVDVNRIEIWVGSQVVVERRIERRERLRLDERIDVPVAVGAQDVLVVVRGEEPLASLPYTQALPFAFANPVRVERTQ